MLLPFLEVKFAVPIKVAAALYIFGPMATPFRNLRLFHAVEAWRVGLNVQHWALVGSVRIAKVRGTQNPIYESQEYRLFYMVGSIPNISRLSERLILLPTRLPKLFLAKAEK